MIGLSLSNMNISCQLFWHEHYQALPDMNEFKIIQI